MLYLMNLTNGSESGFDELELRMHYAVEGEKAPLLTYIAHRGPDLEWCHGACRHLINVCPEIPGPRMRAITECLALITGWTCAVNEPLIASFAAELLKRLAQELSALPDTAESCRQYEHLYVTIHYCLNILANAPTNASLLLLEETALANSGNEFGPVAQQLLEMAKKTRAECEPHYSRFE